MCRVPGRRRMGVGFKIGVGGHTHPPYHDETKASLRRGFFCTERGALNSSSRNPQSSRFQEPEVLLTQPSGLVTVTQQLSNCDLYHENCIHELVLIWLGLKSATGESP